jgi:hypothetical protein
MPSSSLGDRVVRMPARRPAPEPSVATVHHVREMTFGCGSFVRILMTMACVSFGIWAYASPEDAVELITVLDLEEQTIQLDNLFVLAGTPAIDVNEPLFVFVRVLSTLAIVAAGSIPSRCDVVSRVTSFVGYLIALGLFLHVSIEDNGDVLRLWFVITFAVLACGLPAIACAMEAMYVKKVSLPL